MKLLLALLPALSLEVIYNLKTSAGQVIFDQSSEGNHAVVGYNLRQEPEDAILTSRGVYIAQNTLISLPPNSLFPYKDLQNESPEYINLLFYSFSEGCIIKLIGTQETTLKLCLTPSQIWLNINKKIETVFESELELFKHK